MRAYSSCGCTGAIITSSGASSGSSSTICLGLTTSMTGVRASLPCARSRLSTPRAVGLLVQALEVEPQRQEARAELAQRVGRRAGRAVLDRGLGRDEENPHTHEPRMTLFRR